MDMIDEVPEPGEQQPTPGDEQLGEGVDVLRQFVDEGVISEREWEVASRRIRGQSLGEISEALGFSRQHASRVYQRAGRKLSEHMDLAGSWKPTWEVVITREGH